MSELARHAAWDPRLLGLCRRADHAAVADAAAAHLPQGEGDASRPCIWAMTTLVGPVAGPILGGIICDNYGWQWIFFINVPIAAAGGLALL